MIKTYAELRQLVWELCKKIALEAQLLFSVAQLWAYEVMRTYTELAQLVWELCEKVALKAQLLQIAQLAQLWSN